MVDDGLALLGELEEGLALLGKLDTGLLLLGADVGKEKEGVGLEGMEVLG